MDNKNWYKLVLANFKNVFSAKILCYLFFLTIIVFINNLMVLIISQLLFIPMYLGLLYLSMHKQGEHDYNFVKLGKIKKDLYKSLIAGCVLSMPYFISWVALLVFKIFNIFPKYYGIFKILNIQYFPYFSILQTSTNAAEIHILTIVLMIAPVLLMPSISFIAYYFGFNSIWPLRKFIYKKTKKK